MESARRPFRPPMKKSACGFGGFSEVQLDENARQLFPLCAKRLSGLPAPLS
jgi:hypothetical protein